MPQIGMKPIDINERKKVSDAVEAFLRHCRLKNLSMCTQAFHKEDLNHFCAVILTTKIAERSKYCLLKV